MKIKKLENSKSWYLLITEPNEHESKGNAFQKKLKNKLKKENFDFAKEWARYADNYGCIVIHQNAINQAYAILESEQPKFGFF